MTQKNAWLSLCLVAAACGVDSTTSTATTADALVTAQCDFGTFDAAAAACRTTYEACIAAEAADVAACRTALHDCLPPPPDRAGHMEGDGGSCRGPGMGGGDRGGPPPGMGTGGMPPPGADRGGPPPLLPDGGLPPPRHGGRGGHEGRGPHPDPAAVQSCRDALTACLAANPADATCEDTEHACVRAAFDAAFTAACDDATVRCANDTSEPCTRILARCAQGVGGACTQP